MADDADQAQVLHEQDMERAMCNRKPFIEEPDEDEMGRYCLTCGVMIPQRRLQAVPDAVRCVDCQTRHEHKNKQVTK